MTMLCDEQAIPELNEGCSKRLETEEKQGYGI